MNSKTKKVFLSSVTSKIGSGATPHGGSNSYLTTGPFSLIRSQNIQDEGFDYSGIVYINEDQAEKLGNVEVEENDILLNITGDSVARVARVPYAVLPARVNQHVAIIRPISSTLDSDYLYYSLVAPEMNSRLLQIASSGATRNALTKVQIENLEINLPEIETQRTQIAVLKTIDQKIELNRKTNKTLEEMGQALFKHYFIENPDVQNWNKKPLDEIADFLNGIASQKYPVKKDKDTLPVIKIRELSSGINKDSDRVCVDFPQEYIVKNGDFLFAWSGTLMTKIWTEGKGALNQHIFKVTSKDYPKWFYYYWTNHYLQHFVGIAKSKAVTMGHIKRSHLSEAQVLVPPKKFIDEINNIFESNLDMQIVNSIQISNLSKIRDSILPKLMNGDIEV